MCFPNIQQIFPDHLLQWSPTVLCQALYLVLRTKQWAKRSKAALPRSLPGGMLGEMEQAARLGTVRTVLSGWQEVLGATWQKHNIRDANRFLFYPNPNLRNLWSKQPYSVWATQPQNKGDPTKQALRSSLSTDWDWPEEATGDVKDQADSTTMRGAGGSLLEVRVFVPVWVGLPGG